MKMFLGIVRLIPILLILINILHWACVCEYVHESAHADIWHILPTENITFLSRFCFFLIMCLLCGYFCFLHKIKQIYTVDFYMKLHSYQKSSSDTSVSPFLYWGQYIIFLYIFVWKDHDKNSKPSRDKKKTVSQRQHNISPPQKRKSCSRVCFCSMIWEEHIVAGLNHISFFPICRRRFFKSNSKNQEKVWIYVCLHFSYC